MGHTTRSRTIRRSFAKVALTTLTSFTLLAPSLVSASDADITSVADVTNDSFVTLSPGQSAAITINVSVTGPQGGTGTFQVFSVWTLANDVFTGSAPVTRSVPPRRQGDPATTFAIPATVIVDASQAPITKSFTVSTTVTGNTAAPNLRDGQLDGVYTVTVPDTTPPVITPTVTGTLGSDGWYRSNVSVNWTVTDAQSTISSSTGCGPSSVTTDTAGVTFTCSATSAGGSASQSVTIKRDATAPTISATIAPTAAANGWYNLSTGAPTATFSCADAMSGVASCTAPFTFGAGQGLTTSGTVTDAAGNSAGTSAGPVKVDLTAPTLTAALDREPGAAGWFNIATGAPSVVFTCSADVTCPSTHPLGEGADQSYAQTVTDQAGNSTQAGVDHVDVDLTAPTITSAITPAPAANGWYNDQTGAPTVTFTCDDALSLVATCTAPFTFGEGVGLTKQGTVTDTAGNSASTTSAAVKVDLTKPTISASFDVLPAANGWFNSTTGAPTVTFTCTGAVSCPGPIVFGEGADQSFSRTVTDEAGNSATAAASNIDVDTVAPTISASVSPNRPASGWWNIASGAPTVGFVCSDTTSGLDGACPASVSVTTDGADQSVTRSITDAAGNANSATASDLDVDLTAPIIGASISPAEPANGWYNIGTGAPTVSFSCSDVTSGLAAGACPGTHTFDEGTDQSYARSVTDQAGNESDEAGVSDVDVDLTAPALTATVSPNRPASGWWNIASGAPTVSFHCDDETSGVDAAECPADHEFGEGADQTFSATVTDRAGNESDEAGVADIDVDRTRPTITATIAKLPASTGWYNAATGAPTVHFSCDDALSGIDSCSNDHTFGDGDGLTHTGAALDHAGNSATIASSSVKVDTVAPTLTASMPWKPVSGWYSTEPSVSFTCLDATSGVATCPSAYEFSEGADQSYSTTVTDRAGNTSAAAGASDVDVDLTGPSITWNGGPAAGATYYFGFVPAAGTCTASDALSGVAAAGCTVTGYGTGLGAQTMTATATDVAGNTGTATRSYTVLGWTTKGFYQPVEMGGQVVNTVKAGSTVPLKFEVFAGATELSATSVVKSFTTRTVSCSSLAPIEDAVDVTTTGGTSLRYDTTGGQFIQNWQTPKTAGACYLVTVTMQDGSSITANFKLK